MRTQVSMSDSVKAGEREPAAPGAEIIAPLHTPAGGEPLTMSSVEIAKLTRKRHDHVMRDVKSMLAALTMDAPSFGGVYTGGNGEQRPCFKLPKRECLILVSGYSVELRAKIIDRWLELEAREAARLPAISLFDDPVAAARAWADECERRRNAEKMLATAQPKAAFFDRYMESEGVYPLRTAAKIVAPKSPNRFFRSVIRQMVYSQSGGFLPYQQHINDGLMKVNIRSNGRPRAVFTAAGINFLDKRRGNFRLPLQAQQWRAEVSVEHAEPTQALACLTDHPAA